jgi:hypothetical protein
MAAACRRNLHRVRALEPDVIVGAPRSGMIPASILATSLSLPLLDLHSFLSGASAWLWRRGRLQLPDQPRVLLIEDATAWRKTLPAAVEAMPAAAVTLPCAVYATSLAARHLTLAFEICEKPRHFEWNVWRDGFLASCLLDMDGVLCLDPTRDQKTDDATYSAFIAAAAPKYRPVHPIGGVVTGRRERWRAGTEQWLAAHGVKYDVLHMWDGSGTYAEHKAKFYKRHKAKLFIESSEKQAPLIAKLSKKPVLCTKSMRLYK